VDDLEWLGIGLLVLLPAAFVGALFLYLRTSYRSVFLYPDGSIRQGGWKQVRKDFVVAIVTLLAFAVERVVENYPMGRWFK
jgi:uncharacterized membrane-anchored protein